MKIIVFIKQVPDTNEVRINPETGTLIRTGVPSIINPDDKHALEAALALKDQNADVHITVVTMGPPQADVVLREAMAMGCDDAVLISDRAVGGSDTWATSTVLAAAAKKIGDYDLLWSGRQAIDGDTAQVGPQIAQKLDVPQVTYVSDIKIDGDTVTVHRSLEGGYHVIEVKMPCMLTAISSLNTPRYPRIPGIMSAYQKEIPVWGVAELALDPEETGLKGSPTNVFKSFTPTLERAGVVVDDITAAGMAKLVETLQDKNVI